MNKSLFLLFVFFSCMLNATSENDFFRACLDGDYLKVKELYRKEGLRLTCIRDKDDNHPLHIACCSKKGGSKKEIVKFLIDGGASVNAKNKYGSTPLIIAVSNGNYEAAHLLLSTKEIRVNQTYQQNFTPLHLAVTSRSLLLIKLLLTHPDINPNLGTTDGATPLHFAAMEGFIEEAKILIDHPRTDVNAPQHDPIYSGATPLHFAAMQAQPEIVSFLLSKREIRVNAVIDKGSQAGFTPLHYAVSNPDTVNALEVVNLLLSHGADPSLKCEGGKTPFDLTKVSIIQKALTDHKIKNNKSKNKRK